MINTQGSAYAAPGPAPRGQRGSRDDLDPLLGLAGLLRGTDQLIIGQLGRVKGSVHETNQRISCPSIARAGHTW